MLGTTGNGEERSVDQSGSVAPTPQASPPVAHTACPAAFIRFQVPECPPSGKVRWRVRTATQAIAAARTSTSLQTNIPTAAFSS